MTDYERARARARTNADLFKRDYQLFCYAGTWYVERVIAGDRGYF